MKNKRENSSNAYSDRIDTQKFEKYLRHSEYSENYELIKEYLSGVEHLNVPSILIDILHQFSEYLKENRIEVYKSFEEETDKDSLVFSAFLIKACLEFSFPEEQLRNVIADKIEKGIILDVSYEKLLARLCNLEFAKICLRLSKETKYEEFFYNQLFLKKDEIIEAINLYIQLGSEKDLQSFKKYTSKNKGNKGLIAGAILVNSALSVHFQKVSSATEEMGSFLQFVDKKDKNEFLDKFRSILDTLFSDGCFQKIALSELDKDFVWNVDARPTTRMHTLADILETVLPNHFMSMSEWDEKHDYSTKKAYRDNRVVRVKRLIKPYKII